MSSTGSKVKVQHYRAPKGVNGSIPGRYLRGKGFVAGRNTTRKLKPQEKGGYTQVFAAIGGRVLVGRANCRPDEGFSYRVGRVYAIKHLRERLRELGLGFRITYSGQIERLGG